MQVHNKADIQRQQNAVEAKEALIKQHEEQLALADKAIEEAEPTTYTVKEVKQTAGETIETPHGDAHAEMGMMILTDKKENVSVIIPSDRMDAFEEVG